MTLKDTGRLRSQIVTQVLSPDLSKGIAYKLFINSKAMYSI